MRDEGVIFVAGHPLLNRRCTRLPGCIRLRNDLYCVEWGVKLYSLGRPGCFSRTLTASQGGHGPSPTPCTGETRGGNSPLPGVATVVDEGAFT